MPVKIFVCYAHEDEDLLNKLKRHLWPLQRQGLIDVWHDRDISAGLEWEREIRQHLNAAQIILLLVSPDFMFSEYCYSVEMKRAIERHQRGEARVIPVILRPVYWQGILGTLQALPTDAKPVRSWSDVDEAFFDVTEGIHKVIRTLEEQARKAQEEERLRNAREEQPTLTAQKSMLTVGSVVMGRYEITALVADNGQEHVYQVIDHQGWQRCWLCTSENNTESDDFCSDCGASLLEVPYLMHEYSAEQSKEDTPVLQGTIVNTFVDQGRTYVIEQHEAEQFPNGVHLLVADETDAGKKQRHKPNEDKTYVLLSEVIQEAKVQPLGIFFVSNGFGSQGKRQISSSRTLESAQLKAILAGSQGNSQIATRALNTIVQRMNRELFAKTEAEK